MLDIHASAADGLRLLSVAASYNNSEHFNRAPVSAGFKVTWSRAILVKNGAFYNNYGPGGWLDCSSHDKKVTGNNFKGNAGHGMSFELSAKVLFADNLVTGNAGNGVKVKNSSSVIVWNNTLVGNGRPINLVQDDPRASPVTTANRSCHDRRQPLPDPTVTWLLGPVNVNNNVIGRQLASASGPLCIEDYSHLRTADQMGIHSNGNVYNRPTGVPAWTVVWSRGSTNPNASWYPTVAEFSLATGQEADRYGVDGSVVLSTTGITTAAVDRRPAHSGTIAADRHRGGYR